MNQVDVSVTQRQDTAVAVNKVLKNTYLLLAMTLAFSAFTAALSFNAPPVNIWVMIAGFYGLLFATHKLANSPWGLLTTFAFTGFIGYVLGPVIGLLLTTSNGSAIVMQALGGTAFVFFGLSGYALVSRKDFSFLTGFILAGCLTLIAAFVISMIWPMPALALAMSVGFILIGSAMILFKTSEIIRGGERNYILATIELYLALYYIFVGLLNLLMAFSGED